MKRKKLVISVMAVVAVLAIGAGTSAQTRREYFRSCWEKSNKTQESTKACCESAGGTFGTARDPNGRLYYTCTTADEEMPSSIKTSGSTGLQYQTTSSSTSTTTWTWSPSGTASR